MRSGRVPGAQNIGRDWLIPDDAERHRSEDGPATHHGGVAMTGDKVTAALQLIAELQKLPPDAEVVTSHLRREGRIAQLGPVPSGIKVRGSDLALRCCLRPAALG